MAKTPAKPKTKPKRRTAPKKAPAKRQGRPLAYKTQAELQTAIDAYFAACEARGAPYTMSGLAFALGVSRMTIKRYSDKDDFSETIKRARARIEQYNEELLLTSKSATGVIFNLVNNFEGWHNTADAASGFSDGSLRITITVIDSAGAANGAKP